MHNLFTWSRWNHVPVKLKSNETLDTNQRWPSSILKKTQTTCVAAKDLLIYFSNFTQRECWLLKVQGRLSLLWMVTTSVALLKLVNRPQKNHHQLIRFYSHMHVHVFLLFSSPADFVSYLLSVVPDLFCCSRCVTLSSHLHRRMGKSHLWIIPLNTDYCSWKLQPSLTALSWLDLTAKSPTALLNGEPFAVFCKCHTVFNMSVWTPVLPWQPNVSERECSCVCVWLCGCACVSICVCVCKCSENGLSVRCEVLQASTLTAHTRVWVHTLLIRHSPTVFFEVSLCHSHTHVRTHTHAPLLQPLSLSLFLWCFYSNSRQAHKWEKGSSCIQNPEPIKHRLKICIQYQSGVWLNLYFSLMHPCLHV